jgi:glycosyltransferase involved in cell wall biosynthesis
MRPLRIAQVAPLYERVPPALYGGTERVVSWLTEELIRRGHRVTLFASGDSRTAAALVSACERALRLDGGGGDPLVPHVIELSQVFERAADFDVIHCHVDFLAFPFGRLVRTPTIHTLHGRLDLPQLVSVFRRFHDVPVVSISDAQRRPLAHLPVRWVGTVPHGLPLDLYPFSPRPGRYLAFLGRIAPEKRPDLAIAVARRVGLPLKIAAKVDPADRAYYEREIRPLLDDPLVEFVGEIGDAHKPAFLGEALALLFTIDWPEPFGLVMIEALACGTPVIARPCGSVPEVVIGGQTGFIADTIEELVDAVKRVDTIDRAACRRDVEERFTVERMASAYEALYRSLLAERREPPSAGRGAPVQGGEQPEVDLAGAHRDAQVAGEAHRRAVADQDSRPAEPLARRRGVRHADQEEVGLRGR